jgi:poly(A) polymerase
MGTGQNVYPVSIIKPPALSVLERLSRYFSEQGIEAYVVGGLLRDSLLGKETFDIDIVIAADVLEITSDAALFLGGKPVLMDKMNRIGRVVLDRELSSTGQQYIIDLTSFEGDIDQNLAERDFTVNALAVNLNQFDGKSTSIQLMDPCSGHDDLDKHVIRAVKDTVFKSDSIRLLRAVRLATELGFRIEEKTEWLIRQYSSLLTGVVSERVREELLRFLAVPGSGKLLACLDELHLLTVIFPEMEQARGVNQPGEHFWDVYEHSLQTAATVEFLLKEGDLEYTSEEVLAIVPWSEELAQHFAREVSGGSTRKSLLKIAAFLHDVAKPQTKVFDSQGRMRFLGHPREGAYMAAGMLERLRFSTKEVKLVEMLIRHHLRPTQMSQHELPTRRAIYRYFRDTGETGIDILFLSLADHMATRGPELDIPNWKEHTKLVDYVLSQYREQENITHPPKLVDGHDLINMFGMKPGPEMGVLLESVHEAQASGELVTRQEALSFVEKQISFPDIICKDEENSRGTG